MPADAVGGADDSYAGGMRKVARVVLLDPKDRVLLLHGHEPDDPADAWWFTPGGGLEGDETHEEAALRDVPLVAVCALADAPGRLGESRRVQDDFENLVADEAKAHPEVSVWHRVLPGTPRSVLLAAAGDAQLLVVGARGRGGFGAMSLGSVAHAVLQYAPGPVAVVRPG